MATVGLELSTALNTRIPFVSVRSRNLIRGIATWPHESLVKTGERRNRTMRVSKAPAFRCVISRSKKMNWEDVGDPGGSMTDCSLVLLESWANSRTVELRGFNPCPGDCDRVCLYPFQLASWPLEISPRES